MAARVNRGYLAIAAAIVLAGILISVSVISAMQEVQTSTTTVTGSSSSTATYFFGQNVTMQIPQLSSVPASFVVGDYLLTTFQPEPCTGGECSLATTLTIEVGVYCPPNLEGCQHITPQNVSFSWPGGFGQSLPTPANVSLHDGVLNIDWTLESGGLYLTTWEYVHTSSSSS